MSRRKIAYGEMHMHYRRSTFFNALYILLLSAASTAHAKSLAVHSSEYGDKWPFTVSEATLECKINAVIMHTSKGTYSLNGKAMGIYKNRYPTWREIAKPYPGLNDPNAKMPPPNGLIQRGLELCR
jgi:hypothetical protein